MGVWNEHVVPVTAASLHVTQPETCSLEEMATVSAKTPFSRLSPGMAMPLDDDDDDVRYQPPPL